MKHHMTWQASQFKDGSIQVVMYYARNNLPMVEDDIVNLGTIWQYSDNIFIDIEHREW